MADMNTEIKIGADASGVEAGVGRAKRSLKDLGDAALQASRDAAKGLGGVGEGGDKAARQVESATKSVVSSLQRQIAAFEAGGRGTRAYQESMARLNGIDVNAIKPLLDRLDESKAKSEAAAKSANTAAISFERMGISAKAASDTFSTLAVAGLGITAVVGAVTAVSKTLFDASVAAERLKIGLDFASGGNGARELTYVTDLSNKLGLSLQSTASSYMSFAAASRGTALEGAAAKNVFEAVAKASAVMGLTSEQSSGALLALQQMMSKGTVQAEELRGQLGERLPGAFQIAARSMGVTTQELGKMLETGKVLADDFLPRFAAQLENEIGGGAEKAANRLGAATNRIETAIFRMKTALGDSGIAELYAAGLNRGTSVFNAIAGDVEKLNSQGGLRRAADDVNTLHTRQMILKGGIANGFYGKGFQVELDAVSAKLEIAKQKFREVDAASKAILAGAGGGRGSVNPTTTTQLFAKDAANKAERDAYYAQDIRQTKEQIRTEEIGKARKANALLVAKAEGDTNEVLKLQKALSIEIANINERNKDKRVGGGAGGDSELAGLRARGIEIQRYIDSLKVQGLEADKQTASEKIAAKYREELNGGLKGAARATKELQLAQAEKNAGLEKEQAAIVGLLKAQQDFEAARDREAVSRQSEILKIGEKAQALEDEAAAYGKTATELQALTIARLEDKKATLSGFDKEAATAELASINDRIAGLMRLGAASDALASKKLEATAGGWVKMAGEQAKVYQGEAKMAGLSATERAKIVALRKVEIDYVKRIADIDKSIAPDASKESARIEASKAKQIEAATAVSQAIEAEWGKTIDQYDDLFRTGFQQMSLNGEDGIKAFGKTLEAQVYTSIADAIYQALTRKFIVNIIGNVAGGVGGIADAVGLGGGSGGSLLGMASNANSIYGAAGIGSQLMAGGYSAGQMIPAAYAYATGGVLPTAAGLAPLTATAVGSSTVAPVIAGGLVEAGGVVVGGTAIGTTGAVVGAETAATGALGAMGPYGWIALAAIAAYAAFSGKGDSRFGSQAAYTPGEGAVSYGGPNGKGDDFGGVSAANKASALGIDSLLEKLGSADRIFRFSSGFESSENGKGFSYAGGLLDSGKGFGQGNDGMGYMNNRGSMNAEEAAASYANELKQATLQALQAASDIPKSITDKLAGLNIDGLDTKALDELVATIDKIIVEVDAFQGAIGNLPFKNLRDLSFDAASGLIAAAGGLEQLSAGVTGYMDNFATDGERRALKIQQITAALNAAGAGLTEAQVMGASRKDFRDFAGSVDVTTDEGARLYATLLSVQEGFASLTPELISVAGVTAGLPQIIIDGMLSGDAEGAGALFADTLIFSVQNALFSGFADQITSIITDQLVSPMVTALATGASISEAISGAAIESMVAQANAAAKALNAILTDPTFQSAMSQISAAVSGAVSGSIRTAGAGYTPMQAPSRGGSSYAGGGGGSGGGASAADSIKSAWQSITDSIWGEVKRIRGLLEGAGQEGYAAAQARFAIANAQAQAGDQDAYKSLPELSRAMLDLAENNTSTLIELQRIRAQTAASLTATATGVSAAQGLKLPSFAVGTDYVPRDMLAMIHEGERITPRAFNPAIGGAGNDADVVTELRAQNKLLTELLIASKATEKNTGKTASTLVMVTHDGEAMQTEAI